MPDVIMDTQREAYEAAMANEPLVIELVTGLLRKAGRTGLTADELELQSGRCRNTVASCVSRLYKDNYVADSGDRRLTRFNRNAAVWVMPEYL